MGYAIALGVLVALIVFVAMLAVLNPHDGATTKGLAKDGVENQGCIGGCLMLPIVLIVRPFEILFSAIGTAKSAKDEASIATIRHIAIGSVVVGVFFGVIFAVFAVD